MSKLEELIQELCPDGVEYKSITDVFDIRGGYTPSKSNLEYWTNGTIPWFRMEDIRENGHVLSKALQYVSQSAIKKNGLFPANSIALATSATIGEHALITVECLGNQRFTFFSCKEKYNKIINMNFMNHYFYVIDEWCKEHLNQGSFASVDMTALKKLEIPVPPLEVQQEIVRLLDNFTAKTAELQAELNKEYEARKKQYEYYRDTLLNSNTEIPKVKLGDVATIQRGKRVVKTDLIENGDYPVYQNALTPMGYYSHKNRDAGSTYLISAGAAGSIGFSDEDFWAADDCFTFDCKSIISNKYLYYVLLNKQSIINTRIRKASIPRLSRDSVENLTIPLPSLEIQNRLVEILDNFDSICSDLSIDLPAEIGARQKQYEYYRDLLLTFAETGSIMPQTDRQTDRQTSNN